MKQLVGHNLAAQGKLLIGHNMMGVANYITVITAPSFNTALLKVGNTLASAYVPGTYSSPVGPVTESTLAFNVDDFSQPSSYTIVANDLLISVDVTLSENGIVTSIILPVGPINVTNTPPIAVTGSSNITVPIGTATVPAQMSAPTLVSTATRITITKAADPSNGGSAITSYDYRYSTDVGTSWTIVTGFTSPAVQTGFVPGATGMLVQERAVNAVGAGAWSTSASIDMKEPLFLGYQKLGGTGASITLDLTAALLTDTGGSGAAIQENDVCFVLNGWATSGANENPGVSTAGYVEIDDLFASSTRAANLSLNWKAMGATPDTSVVANGPNNAANGGIAIASLWRYIDPATPLDVTYVSGTHSSTITSSALVDPPAITPVSVGAPIIVAAGATGDTTPVTLTSPSNMTNSANVTNGGSTRGFRGTISRYMSWTSGAFDPAAHTSSESAASDAGIAMTLALKPW